MDLRPPNGCFKLALCDTAFCSRPKSINARYREKSRANCPQNCWMSNGHSHFLIESSIIIIKVSSWRKATKKSVFGFSKCSETQRNYHDKSASPKQVSEALGFRNSSIHRETIAGTIWVALLFDSFVDEIGKASRNLFGINLHFHSFEHICFVPIKCLWNFGITSTTHTNTRHTVAERRTLTMACININNRLSA